MIILVVFGYLFILHYFQVIECDIYVQTRDVEAVEYFLLPFPARYKVSRFRVCFYFQLLSSKCFRFTII